MRFNVQSNDKSEKEEKTLLFQVGTGTGPNLGPVRNQPVNKLPEPDTGYYLDFLFVPMGAFSSQNKQIEFKYLMIKQTNLHFRS